MFALRRVRDHIDRNFAAPITLSELAALGGMSRFHLIKSFRTAYGETPIRYVTGRRVARAQELLRHANVTVTEVCVAVGYTSLGSFSSKFTEVVGESPSAYQRRWADRNPHIPGCWLFMLGTIPEKPVRSPRA